MTTFDPFDPNADPLDAVITFGQYKGATWYELLNAAEEDEQIRSWLDWALAECELITRPLHDILMDEVEERRLFD